MLVVVQTLRMWEFVGKCESLIPHSVNSQEQEWRRKFFVCSCDCSPDVAAPTVPVLCSTVPPPPPPRLISHSQNLLSLAHKSDTNVQRSSTKAFPLNILLQPSVNWAPRPGETAKLLAKTNEPQQRHVLPAKINSVLRRGLLKIPSVKRATNRFIHVPTTSVCHCLSLSSYWACQGSRLVVR